jgi:protein SCO1
MSLSRRAVMASCVFALTIGALSACGRREPPAKQYELTGQILAVKPETQEVLVKHGDIKGFMPAMTMPYTVEDPSLLKDKAPGDLVSATLVVGETRAYLSALTKTGHAAIDTPPAEPEVSVFDLVKQGQPVPDVTLVDEDGQSRPLSSYRGNRVALTFIYTRCPDPEFCPLMNQQFAAVQKLLTRRPDLDDVRLLSISFDPAYDTPAVLKTFAKTQEADPDRWHFVTGKPDEITQFAARFGVTATSNGTPVLIHNLGTAVIDAQGRLVTLRSTNQWKPAELIDDLKTAAAAEP